MPKRDGKQPKKNPGKQPKKDPGKQPKKDQKAIDERHQVSREDIKKSQRGRKPKEAPVAKKPTEKAPKWLKGRYKKHSSVSPPVSRREKPKKPTAAEKRAEDLKKAQDVYKLMRNKLPPELQEKIVGDYLRKIALSDKASLPKLKKQVATAQWHKGAYGFMGSHSADFAAPPARGSQGPLGRTDQYIADGTSQIRRILTDNLFPTTRRDGRRVRAKPKPKPPPKPMHLRANKKKPPPKK